MTKLSGGERHLLELVAKEQVSPNGWAVVSKVVYPLMQKLPVELIDLLPVDESGKAKARLTEKGESVLAAMEYLL